MSGEQGNLAKLRGESAGKVGQAESRLPLVLHLIA